MTSWLVLEERLLRLHFHGRDVTSFPRPYGSNVHCAWTIRVEHFKNVVLNFVHFDLGHDGQSVTQIHKTHFWRKGIYHVRLKKLQRFIFAISLSNLYSDNFWHTYTTINLLSPVYFMFFMKLKTGNQLKFQQYSTYSVAAYFIAHVRLPKIK